MICRNKKLSFFLLTLSATVFTACPHAPNDRQGEESPWLKYGLEDHSVHKLRLFDNQLYAITRQRGLYRRNIHDESSEWQYLGFKDTVNGWPNTEGVVDVYINTNKPRQIMISMYQSGYETDPSIHTVYASQDDGVSWQPSDSGLVWDGNDSSLFKALPGELEGMGDKVYAVTTTYGGIYVSDDFGKTWDVFLQGYATTYLDLHIHPLNNQVMWSVTMGPYGDSGIGKTSDGGITWQDLPESFAKLYQFVDDIALDPLDPNIVYVGAEGNIYKTEDFGDAWIQILLGDSTDFRFSLITINDKRPNHIVAHGSNKSNFRSIWESWDGGTSWREIDYPYEFLIHFPSIFDPINDVLYFPTDGGVLKYKSSK